MRSKKRIDPFLKHVNWFYLLHNQWNLFNSKLKSGEYVFFIQNNIKHIRKYWKKNSDLRISQVLVNLNIIPNIQGLWYYMEEHQILMEQEDLTTPENCLLWTSVLNKHNKRRKKHRTKLIKNLSKSHVRNIINYVKTNSNKKLHPKILEAFNNVLNRKNIFRKLWDWIYVRNR